MTGQQGVGEGQCGSGACTRCIGGQHGAATNAQSQYGRARDGHRLAEGHRGSYCVAGVEHAVSRLAVQGQRDAAHCRGQHVHGLRGGIGDCIEVAGSVGGCTCGHAYCDVALSTGNRCDHQGVDGGAHWGEGALATVGNRDVTGIKPGHWFSKAEGVGDVATGDVAGAALVIGDDNDWGCRIHCQRLRCCSGDVASRIRGCY